nr:MBL fold metallo-hydrolase [Mesorhizobium camelthorni]
MDFRFGRRAMLFDIGDLTPLAPREIARVTHVFVSHMHMDHFTGFDRLLCLKLHKTDTVHFIGPPGLGDAVDAKLKAYTWNLLDAHSADFVIVASEWSRGGFTQCGTFHARDAFRRGDAVQQMKRTFVEQGLEEVAETQLMIRTDYQSFDDYWTPIAAGEGPLGKYVATLDAAERARTDAAVRDAYPMLAAFVRSTTSAPTGRRSAS